MKMIKKKKRPQKLSKFMVFSHSSVFGSGTVIFYFILIFFLLWRAGNDENGSDSIRFICDAKYEWISNAQIDSNV